MSLHKPFMPQTHTVPGFRLDPDLPREAIDSPCECEQNNPDSLALRRRGRGAIDSPCECEHNNPRCRRGREVIDSPCENEQNSPDSLDARLFPSR